MAILILDTTGANIAVKCSVAGKQPDLFLGDSSRSFNQALRNSVRGRKKVRTVTTTALTAAEETAIQNAILAGRQITCNGDVLDGLATICEVICNSSKLMETLPGNWQMTLTISEA